MPFSDDLRWSVAFIVGGRNREPIGTGFFVSVRERMDEEPYVIDHPYVVTAGHVVRRAGDSWVRLHKKLPGRSWRNAAGGVEDVPLPSWYFNDDPGKDIAIAPIAVPEEEYLFRTISARTEGEEGELPRFSNIAPWGQRDLDRDAALGDRVFFLGLLAHVDRMGQESIPMARGGTLGAIWQPDIPMDFGGGTQLSVTGHLIDCNAYRGFSGSPVFVHRKIAILKENRRRSGYARSRDETITYEHQEVEQSSFLGMLVGHFPVTEKVYPPEDDRPMRLPVNAGVAVVIPRE